MNDKLNTGTKAGPLEKLDEFNWLILEVFSNWNPSLDHVPSHIKNQKLLKEMNLWLMLHKPKAVFQ